MIKFIYRHKIKIAVSLFFIVGLFLGDFFNVSKLYYGYDRNQYFEAFRLFEKNEKEAIDILKNLNLEDSEYSINELENGLYLWLENRRIMDNVSRIENITNEMRQKSLDLVYYSKLRVIYFSYLKKNLSDGVVGVYDNKISELENKINKFLKENNLDSINF